MNKIRKIKVLGLMSGTSMDGLDCGLFEIYLDQKYLLEWHCLDFKTFKYSNKIRENISSALDGDINTINRLDKFLGIEIAKLSKKFIKKRHVDYIASHGQTLLHVDGVSSLQISDPKYLYQTFNVPVVYDFRQLDINLGGNGAPLMPFLDWLLFKNSSNDIITLNIGGISNISFIPASNQRNDVIGFDTGPGMSLMDECSRYFYNQLYDLDGRHSEKGVVDIRILEELMLDNFINKKPPKSTGRHEFGLKTIYYFKRKYSDISPNDLLRTFCAFTAKSIALNLTKFLNINISTIELIVSGGGVHHPILMEYLKEFTSIDHIKLIDTYGIDSDMKESLLMAVLGVAYINNIPSNMPSVTGAKKLAVLGKLYK
jgi:anhydro-N-acetylmuramic acid kinase